ncbi:hypothetical protein EST38_g625 [Candolleomyces aberdarensis]|uniref:chitin deacetylase n=1 Tax=Candolleomyces aberdarensis TaxID=2316362 RepID=A0A4Q2E1J9_9AGAR|nr:hypothetical protein EST38_g625 [Candolleomyces aberdarensis]
MLCSAWLLLAALPSVFAASVPLHDSHDHDHSHVERTQLPGGWYQPESHPVHKLFRRAPDDGVQRPAVGSAEWAAPYPRGVPDSSQLPQAWVAALNAAVAAGDIPDIPQTTNTPQTNPVYPAGVNPVSIEVCSATYKCRNPEDLWDAPDGVFASSFDDGPYPATAQLVDFLTSNDVKTTHFMIGINILNYPALFLQAFDAGGDIAVHTYNHLYMTTLSNLDIVAQLGWTMQIIHESTGGRIPRYWRPPYGDSDNRVRAIAKEVFGMETVIWNQDTSDWNLAAGSTTQETIHQQMTQWLAGPKSPGLMILEHEINEQTVGAFIAAFPLIAQNGWRFESLASAYGVGAYQNAASSTSDDVEEASIVDRPGDGDSTTTSASETATQTAPAELPATTSPSGSSKGNSSSGISVRHGYFWTTSVLISSFFAALLL